MASNLDNGIAIKRLQSCSPDEAKRNPGSAPPRIPACCLHPGYAG